MFTTDLTKRAFRTNVSQHLITITLVNCTHSGTTCLICGFTYPSTGALAIKEYQRIQKIYTIILACIFKIHQFCIFCFLFTIKTHWRLVKRGHWFVPHPSELRNAKENYEPLEQHTKFIFHR